MGSSYMNEEAVRVSRRPCPEHNACERGIRHRRCPILARTRDVTRQFVYCYIPSEAELP